MSEAMGVVADSGVFDNGGTRPALDAENARVRDLETYIAEMETELLDVRLEAARGVRLLYETEDELKQLSAHLMASGQEIALLREERTTALNGLQEQRRRRSEVDEEVDRLRISVGGLECRLRDAWASRASLASELEAARSACSRTNRVLSEILASRSWRHTLVLRRLAGWCRRLSSARVQSQ